jgi:hypothetical protein
MSGKEERPGRLFVYPTAYFAGVIFWSCFPVLPFLMALLAILWAGRAEEFPQVASSFAAPFVPIWIIWWGVMAWKTFTYSPVRISARGVAAEWLGRPWRSIAWSSRPTVTKNLNVYDSGPVEESIEIVDGDRKISIASKIVDYSDLKEQLSALAAEHDLPLAIVDRTRWKRRIESGPDVRL